MIPHLTKVLLLALLLIVSADIAAAQQTTLPDASSRSGRPARRDTPFGVDEMLAKQRAARDKKDHEKMLERGEQALKLANQLEAAFAQNKSLSAQDRVKLESLEDVVLKIRSELGGDDDGDEDPETADETPKPSTVEEAFQYLKSTTVKLVDELKKTTRFSISAVAIHSSNQVLKLVKFLRIRR